MLGEQTGARIHGTNHRDAGPVERLDLDRKHLDVRHLGVEELHDAGEWVRRGSGMKSATTSNRRRFAAGFVDTASQNSSTSGSPSVCSNAASSASALRPRASDWRSNMPHSSSAVQVSEACAAYSRSCPTIARRISGFEPRFTSASVGTASEPAASRTQAGP